MTEAIITYQVVGVVVFLGQHRRIIFLITFRGATQILIALMRQMLLDIDRNAAVPLPELQSNQILGAECICGWLLVQLAIVFHYGIAELRSRKENRLILIRI